MPMSPSIPGGADEEHGFLTCGQRSLFTVVHIPSGTPRAALLFCQPLFEERKSAHRVFVDAARILAARGMGVVRFDYSGCGDSSGEFQDFSVPQWLEDVREAFQRLDRFGSCPRGVLGLRFGAALALAALPALSPVRFLALWEPVLRGDAYLEQELRKKLVREMVTAGRSTVTRDALIRRLDEGHSIDFDGYPITPSLFRHMSDLRVVAPLPFSGAAKIFCVSPRYRTSADVKEVERLLHSGGGQTEICEIALPPFWNLIGLTDATPLIEATADWIDHAIRDAGTANHD